MVPSGTTGLGSLMRGKKVSVPEEQLIAARDFYEGRVGERRHTLEETAHHVGISRSVLLLRFKEKGWVRPRGGKVRPSVVSSYDDADLLKFKASWDQLESTVKGSISESFVKAALASRAFDVWDPVTQNHRTDLLLLSPGRMARLQVKTATYDPQSKSFRANLTRHRRSGGHPWYAEGDVDFFAVYCAGLPSVEIYILPVAAAARTATPRFFPHRKMTWKSKEICWEDYRNAFHLLVEALAL